MQHVDPPCSLADIRTPLDPHLVKVPIDDLTRQHTNDPIRTTRLRSPADRAIAARLRAATRSRSTGRRCLSRPDLDEELDPLVVPIRHE